MSIAPVTLPPGVYFGLSEEAYHALPYLSASGMKHLLVSPMDYWSRSWMNPWREEDENESEAKTLGKAYHKRILEGRDAFDAAYAPPFTIDDPDVLKGNDALKAALKEMGVKGYSGKNKDELIQMVQEADPMRRIWEVEEAEYRAAHPGKEFLDEKFTRKIELTAKVIECHPALRYYFVGGRPEVSVIWHDQEFDLTFKARFDYLKVSAVNDLKTFANMTNKTIEKAVYSAMAGMKYHIQAVLYLRATENMKALLLAGSVHGHESIDPSWLNAVASSEEHCFNFCFVQKGPAPVAVGAEFPRGDNMYHVGVSCINQAVESYKHCLKTFGTDPWIDMRDPIVLNAGSYPSFAMDI